MPDREKEQDAFDTSRKTAEATGSQRGCGKRWLAYRVRRARSLKHPFSRGHGGDGRTEAFCARHLWAGRKFSSWMSGACAITTLVMHAATMTPSNDLGQLDSGRHDHGHRSVAVGPNAERASTGSDISAPLMTWTVLAALAQLALTTTGIGAVRTTRTANRERAILASEG
jgi:hypothetical protein